MSFFYAFNHLTYKKYNRCHKVEKKIRITNIKYKLEKSPCELWQS